ncbi:MAG: hypothetical protein GY739_19305 [Mesoflavibacter sp.]|nr:hypothetical protein [Mesoflavibacter sp.]
MNESNLTKRIMLALPKLVRVFRNHVGVIKDEKGKYHKAGLMPGSADLIGYAKVKITQDMIGKILPVFTSLEVKTDKGKQHESQLKWQAGMRKINAIHGVVRTPDDAEQIVNSWIQEQEK